MKLQDRGDFKVDTMKGLLKSCFENLEGEYAGAGHPEWWASGKGGGASYLNQGALSRISQDMSRALHQVSTKADEIML